MSNGSGSAKVNTLLFFLVGLLSGGIVGYILGGAGPAAVTPSGMQPSLLQLNDILPVEDAWIVEGFSCPMPGCTNPLLTCKDELSRRIRDWVNSELARGRPGEDIRAEIIQVHGANLNKLKSEPAGDSAAPATP
jgi:hypothetical protein